MVLRNPTLSLSVWRSVPHHADIRVGFELIVPRLEWVKSLRGAVLKQRIEFLGFVFAIFGIEPFDGAFNLAFPHL